MEVNGWKERLRAKTKKLGQKAVAKELNSSQPSISEWLKGDYKPSITKIPALAKLLDMPVDELIKEINEQ